MKDVLPRRKMSFCLEQSSASTDGELLDDIQSPQQPEANVSKRRAEGVSVERGLFVSETSQLISFVN